MQVLIVEDDRDLAIAIAEYLSLQGVECDFAHSGSAALEIALQTHFDIIVLDLMLPGVDGFRVCQSLRSQGCSTPVLMLTACDTDQDQLQGFDVGIDDFVAKPCSMPVLWARLQAIYKRLNPAKDEIHIGPLSVYLQEHRAVRGDRSLKLTPTAWKMLEYLARHSPNVVTRTELEDYIWPDTDVEVGNFNVHLHQLRKIVDKPFDQELIHTLVGVGLCLKYSDDVNACD